MKALLITLMYSGQNCITKADNGNESKVFALFNLFIGTNNEITFPQAR
jgi:hypothetical protein